MPHAVPVDPDTLRARFSEALSAMYREEVPLYGDLLALVARTNRLAAPGGADTRLEVERHGAIRLGTADELVLVARLFAVLGLHPVGYYDLAPAGVPVHSTAFRPITAHGLATSPFRVFTSLLRLELIADPALREEAAAILSRRRAQRGASRRSPGAPSRPSACSTCWRWPRRKAAWDRRTRTRSSPRRCRCSAGTAPPRWTPASTPV